MMEECASLIVNRDLLMSAINKQQHMTKLFAQARGFCVVRCNGSTRSNKGFVPRITHMPSIRRGWIWLDVGWRMMEDGGAYTNTCAWEGRRAMRWMMNDDCGGGRV